MEIMVEKFVDRKKLVGQASDFLDNLAGMMNKNKLTQDDYGRLKIARTAAPMLRVLVDMAQQETMMVRASLIAERMKQLGYEQPKQIE